MDNISDALKFQDEIKSWSMQFMAKIYLESSMICATDAKSFESEPNEDYYQKNRYLKNVLGSIVFAVMFLEATINEFFINLTDDFWFDQKINENLRNI